MIWCPEREAGIPKYFWLYYELIFLRSGNAWELPGLCGSDEVSVPSLSQTSFQLWESWLRSQNQKSPKVMAQTRPLSLQAAQFRNPGVATELLGSFSQETDTGSSFLPSQAARYHQTISDLLVFPKEKFWNMNFWKVITLDWLRAKKPTSSKVSKFHFFNIAE